MLRGREIFAALAPALLAACAVISDQPDAVVLPYVKSFSDSRPGDGMPQGWEPWTLSKFKKPTQYSLVDNDGRTVVKARAHASASGLVHRLQVDPKRYPLLQWRWKVTELIAQA